MSITAVLTAYRRPQHLQQQIDAIRPQVDHIMLYQNIHSDFNLPPLALTLGFNGIDETVQCNYNHKYHGRFAAALLARTKYVIILDDDTVPGSEYVQSCMEAHQKTYGLIGGVGITFNKDFVDYTDHQRYGWPVNPTLTEVDFVGHSWFMPYRFLRYFWDHPLASYETGEDMHFSYCLKERGINSYVAPQEGETCSSLYGGTMGVDHTTPSCCEHPDHYPFRDERNRVLQTYIQRKWKLIEQS